MGFLIKSNQEKLIKLKEKIADYLTYYYEVKHIVVFYSI